MELIETTCEHVFDIPTIFEESPNGDDGAWCSASKCSKCGVIYIFNMGIGEFK